MSSINLLNAIANLLNCEMVALHDYLNHPMAENKINEFLKGKKLSTTYASRTGERKLLEFGGFTLKATNQQMAYEGYLGVTVQQHFYCRHRIRLMYPRLKCVIENYGNSGHHKYYPAELLEIVPPSYTPAAAASVQSPLELVIDTSKWYDANENDAVANNKKQHTPPNNVGGWFNSY